jgi:NADH:ubiquinone oxidoreductase subunit E
MDDVETITETHEQEDEESKVDSKKKGVLVIGGGIGGIQASLDMADSGRKVYLLEKTPSLGGRMSQLDKTFPTNDCAMCTLSPKLVGVGGHSNIELLTHSELIGVEGEAGNFKVKVNRKARSIDEDKCTGCGVCIENCPINLLPQVPEKPKEAPKVREQEKIDAIIQENSHFENPLIQIMLDVNEKFRYLPKDVLEYLSFKLDVPLSYIYRLATFYKAFSLELRGKYHIKVCLGTACHVRGARQVVDRIRERVSEAEEGLLSLETVNCLGTCAIGPVMMINEDVSGNLNLESVDKILSSLEEA